jgi:hypothetical protein
MMSHCHVGTPQSSQIVWIEQRIAELEAANDSLAHDLDRRVEIEELRLTLINMQIDNATCHAS